jgi:hypothetical protein
MLNDEIEKKIKKKDRKTNYSQLGLTCQTHNMIESKLK